MRIANSLDWQIMSLMQRLFPSITNTGNKKKGGASANKAKKAPQLIDLVNAAMKKKLARGSYGAVKRRFGATTKVQVTQGYEYIADSLQGPLFLGDVGEVVTVLGERVCVEFEGRTFWYLHKALRGVERVPLTAAASASAGCSSTPTVSPPQAKETGTP